MTYRLLLCTFIAALVFSASSCKKKSTDDTSSTSYYVKIKKNGNWINYPTVAGELGPDLGDPTYTDLGVSARSTNADDAFDISIQIHGTNFTTGTYISNNTNYQVIISDLLHVGSSSSHYDISDAPGMAPSLYTVTITSITTDAITGTFTGNYLYNDFASGSTATLLITDGEFHVKRVR